MNCMQIDEMLQRPGGVWCDALVGVMTADPEDRPELLCRAARQVEIQMRAASYTAREIDYQIGVLLAGFRQLEYLEATNRGAVS